MLQASTLPTYRKYHSKNWSKYIQIHKKTFKTISKLSFSQSKPISKVSNNKLSIWNKPSTTLKDKLSVNKKSSISWRFMFPILKIGLWTVSVYLLLPSTCPNPIFTATPQTHLITSSTSTKTMSRTLNFSWNKQKPKTKFWDNSCILLSYKSINKLKAILTSKTLPLTVKEPLKTSPIHPPFIFTQKQVPRSSFENESITVKNTKMRDNSKESTVLHMKMSYLKAYKTSRPKESSLHFNDSSEVRKSQINSKN